MKLDQLAKLDCLLLPPPLWACTLTPSTLASTLIENVLLSFSLTSQLIGVGNFNALQ